MAQRCIALGPQHTHPSRFVQNAKHWIIIFNESVHHYHQLPTSTYLRTLSLAGTTMFRKIIISLT